MVQRSQQSAGVSWWQIPDWIESAVDVQRTWILKSGEGLLVGYSVQLHCKAMVVEFPNTLREYFGVSWEKTQPLLRERRGETDARCWGYSSSSSHCWLGLSSLSGMITTWSLSYVFPPGRHGKTSCFKISCHLEKKKSFFWHIHCWADRQLCFLPKNKRIKKFKKH